MELNRQDIEIAIQALENIPVPVNQAQRVIEIINKLKLMLANLTDIQPPVTN